MKTIALFIAGLLPSLGFADLPGHLAVHSVKFVESFEVLDFSDKMIEDDRFVERKILIRFISAISGQGSEYQNDSIEIVALQESLSHFGGVFDDPRKVRSLWIDSPAIEIKKGVAVIVGFSDNISQPSFVLSYNDYLEDVKFLAATDPDNPYENIDDSIMHGVSPNKRTLTPWLPGC